jgi:hypothetical protein
LKVFKFELKVLKFDLKAFKVRVERRRGGERGGGAWRAWWPGR